jgi:hypothetical protein
MKKIILSLAALIVFQGIIFAAGETAGISLGEDLFARPSSMADTYTAFEGGMPSIAFNPAGIIGFSSKHNLSFCYSSKLINTNLGFAGYGFKFGDNSLVGALTYLNSGTETFFSSAGPAVEKVALLETTIHIVYSRQVFERLAVGGAVKNFSTSLVEQYSASTILYDAGLIYKDFYEGFSFGASFLNNGGGIKYVTQEEKLPQQTKIGFMYTREFEYPSFMTTERQIILRAFTDWSQMNAGGSIFSLGVEGDFDAVSVRLGSKSGSDGEGFAAGLGFKAQNGLTLDYSLGLRAEIDPVHKLTLNISFN